MSDVDPKVAWRQYLAGGHGVAAHEGDLRVALAGSMTVEPVEPYLGAYLLGRRLRPHVTIGPFDQLQHICHDYQAVFGSGDLNAIALIWRLEDLFPDALTHCLDAPQDVGELLRAVQGFADSVAVLRRQFSGTLVVSTPPWPTSSGFELLDTGQPSCGMRVFNAVSQFWTREMAKLERVRLLDLHGLMLHVGFRQAHDARKWHLYRQPYAEAFCRELGRMLGRIIASEKLGPKKCVVLDLDNTLWGGIVGEEGIGGIQLGEDFPGSAYRSFQRSLKRLKSKGVLLAVASKNNPADAYEVFDTHDAMVLARRDISVFEIHWDSKVDSIRRIAKKLNIGLDAVVFVDDNAKEIAEVSERLPEVTCVIVPEELAHLPALFADSDLFDIAEQTDEDRRRTEMIEVDAIREQAQERMSEEEFRHSSNLKIDVFDAEPQHLARAAQLINKTNQFNLTTIRRTHDEVAALASGSDTRVLCMTVSDKYGDYGLVGVAILRRDRTVCIIDTLLMSCRVLGRGAEQAFVAGVASAAQALGCDELRGKYIPTPKNALVADLYERLKFTHDAHADEWSLPLTPACEPGGVKSLTADSLSA